MEIVDQLMRAMKTRPKSLAGAVIALSLICLSARAQVSCGDASKDIPLSTQEQLRGDVEGKAQALTKLLGDAEVKGSVEASREELHQQHPNVDEFQMDMFFMWISC
jgi:hypothetical protein